MSPPLLNGAEVFTVLLPESRISCAAWSEMVPARPVLSDADWIDA